MSRYLPALFSDSIRKLSSKVIQIYSDHERNFNFEFYSILNISWEMQSNASILWSITEHLRVQEKDVRV